MDETILEYPFIRMIPFPYQFVTSGNEIGKAKTQFGKQNMYLRNGVSSLPISLPFVPNWYGKGRNGTVRRDRFGEADSAQADSALADSAQGLFGAISIFYHNQWMVRVESWSPGANWVRCPERHTGIFFLNFFLENIKKVPRRVINVNKVPRRVRNVKKLPRRVSAENRGLGFV